MNLEATKMVGLLQPKAEPVGFKLEKKSRPEAEFKVPGLPEPKDPRQARKLWEAAKALEVSFSKYMLKDLGKTIPKSGHATGSEIYGDMFKQAVAEEIADGGTLGMARQVYIDLNRALDRAAEAEDYV